MRIAAVLVVTLIVSTGAYAAESDVLIEVAPRVVPLGEPVTLSGKILTGSPSNGYIGKRGLKKFVASIFKVLSRRG